MNAVLGILVILLVVLLVFAAIVIRNQSQRLAARPPTESSPSQVAAPMSLSPVRRAATDRSDPRPVPRWPEETNLNDPPTTPFALPVVPPTVPRQTDPTEVAVPEAVRVDGGRAPVEPQGPTGGQDPVADSEVDGATIDFLVVRSASIRGDRGRRDLAPRADAHLVRSLGGGYGRDTLACIVATGLSALAQPVAAQACRNLFTQLSRHGGSIDAAWRAQAGDDLRQLLNGTCKVVSARLAELTSSRQGTPKDAAVELACLLTDVSGSRPRRHLAFAIGGGGVVKQADTGWQTIFSGTNGIAGGPLIPEVPPAVEFAWLETTPNELLAVTGRTGMPVFGDALAGAYFAEEWRKGPRDLVEFLWQFSARTSATLEDRSVVCLWDFAPVTGNTSADRTSLQR